MKSNYVAQLLFSSLCRYVRHYVLKAIISIAGNLMTIPQSLSFYWMNELTNECGGGDVSYFRLYLRNVFILVPIFPVEINF